MGKFVFGLGVIWYTIREILISLGVLMVCDYARECSHSERMYTAVFSSEGWW